MDDTANRQETKGDTVEMTREEIIANMNKMAKISMEPGVFYIMTDKDLETVRECAALLNQKPHILTKDDFIDNPMCDRNDNLPVWIEYRTGRCGWTQTSAETMIPGMYAYGRQKYRYWTGKPTKELMKEVKWDD